MNELANCTPTEFHSAYNVTATLLLKLKSVSPNCGKRRSDGTNGSLGNKRSVDNYLCPVNLGDLGNLSLKVSSAEVPSITPLYQKCFHLFIYSLIHYWSPSTLLLTVSKFSFVLWLKYLCLSKIHVET